MNKKTMRFILVTTLVVSAFFFAGCQRNIKYKNGDTYKGEATLLGVPKGTGTYQYKNGDKYEGTFENGKMEGNGKIIYKDGGFLDGKFSGGSFNGKANIKSKNDKPVFEGDIYGNFKNESGKLILTGEFTGKFYEPDGNIAFDGKYTGAFDKSSFEEEPSFEGKLEGKAYEGGKVSFDGSFDGKYIKKSKEIIKGKYDGIFYDDKEEVLNGKMKIDHNPEQNKYEYTIDGKWNTGDSVMEGKYTIKGASILDETNKTTDDKNESMEGDGSITTKEAKFVGHIKTNNNETISTGKWYKNNVLLMEGTITEKNGKEKYDVKIYDKNGKVIQEKHDK